MAMTQAVATMPAARPGVRFLEYSTASVMAQYLSSAITHRCSMDAVQHVMSDESQISQTICPSVQVWITVYKTQMGITNMDTRRSVTAREAIRKFAGVCSFLDWEIVAMTKALDKVVASVMTERIAAREI